MWPGVDPTKYQTKEDAVIIRDLIESYITDRRTIIMYALLFSPPQSVRRAGFC